MQVTDEYSVIALLPMKGHSERVPGKNMRLLDGRPLYHRVAISLQRSRFISSIIIDTDSQEIARDVSKNFPEIIVLDRPKSIRGDMVSMNTIIDYDISQVKGEHFLQTHSTNPMLTPATIDKAIGCYFSNLDKYDSLFSVTRRQVRMYWRDVRPVNHELHIQNETLRTQDLEPLYEENSCLYVFSRSSFAGSGNWRIGLKPQMFELDKIESVDIDEEQDFNMADMIHRARLSHGESN